MLLKWGFIGQFQECKSGEDAPKVGNHRVDTTLIGIFREDAPKVENHRVNNTLIGIFREDSPKVGTIELIVP